MTIKTCGIAIVGGALLLGGCAHHGGYGYEDRVAELFEEFREQRDATIEPGDVRLAAADWLGQQMDRSARRQSRQHAAAAQATQD